MGVSPPLQQRGLQGPWDWLLREPGARSVTPFPSARRGGPCKRTTRMLPGSFRAFFFLFVSHLSCKPKYAYKQKKASAKAEAMQHPCCPFAERRGFEPLKHFWRLLTFQASQFNHSCTSPFWCDKGNYFFDNSCA